MAYKQLMTAEQAAELVQDEDVLVTSGFVACQMPEYLSKALENRFLKTGSPKNLTLLYAAAQGNRDGSGADHFAHKGLLHRVIGGHYNMSPALGKMIIENEIEGYNFPQGTLSQLFREMAGKRPGVLTHVGIGTFVDPRLQGGKLNSITTEDLVQVVNINGTEKLLYLSPKADVAFIRGTVSDENGNVTLEKECCTNEATAIAAAVHNNGGKVIVQVERVVKNGSVDPRLVKIPGIYVDALVICDAPEDHMQCQGQEYDGSMTGDFRIPLNQMSSVALDAKKIIARRAVLDLLPDTVVNLGIGAPEYISMVANEEGIGDYMTLTVEAGPIGGVPQGGPKFGGAVNVEAIVDQPYQFDFYDGGGVDLAFLGLAELDMDGNINVSKFGVRLAGCGGFINITQNAKKVYFCGTFTAGGLREHCEDGRLVIDQEGRKKKLIPKVEQITFSGKYAAKTKQPVTYITERAVFELHEDGIWLTEIAPGIDLRTQVLDLMDFVPQIPKEGPVLMDQRIFRDEKMNIQNGKGDM